MKRITRHLGTSIYWLGWVFFRVYFLYGKRTRVLLICDDRVLVVAGWLSNARWGLPGGGLHRKEAPAVGAVRELQEEVGITLDAADLVLIGAWPYRHHGYRYEYFQFIAHVDRELPVRKQWHEIVDARWVPYQELNQRNSRPDVLRAIAAWRETLRRQ